MASAANVHLKFVDFIPKKVKSGGIRSSPRFESFHFLISRLNDWLQDNREYRVISCEVLDTYGNDRGNVSVDTFKADFSLGTDHGHAHRLDSWMLLVLRAWLVPNNNRLPLQKVGYCNITPKCTIQTLRSVFKQFSFQRMDEAVDDLNRYLETGQEKVGEVLNLNTFVTWVRNINEVDPEYTYYDLLDCDFQIQFIKIFYDENKPGPNNVSFKDFVPSVTKQKGYFKKLSYGSFPGVFSEAKSWVSSRIETRQIELINVETVRFFLPGKSEEEHFSSNKIPQGAIFINDTMYFIRVHFTQSSSPGSEQLPPPYPITATYSDIIPRQVSRGSLFRAPKYEDFSDCVQSSDLGIPYGQLLGVNSVKFSGKKYPPDTAETHSDQINGKWLNIVRLYWNK